jgi:hypothetical protein
VAIIGRTLAAPIAWPAGAVPAGRFDELVAAAAAVTRLMDGGGAVSDGDRRGALLEALIAGPPPDVDRLLAEGRRLGFELGEGAMAICARGAPGRDAAELGGDDAALMASLGHGVTVGLVPLSAAGAAGALADRLSAAGFAVGVSAARREPALLHEALREAMLLAELGSMPEAALAGQEDTYRLLIGVLLRDPGELEGLRSSTISPLLAYDAEHDTELVSTLATFLAHHGSTTDAAEVMRLHRHTVGYRLARVQGISGLSPYESEGRERLGLGLKATQILIAQERLLEPG